ncbi:hypothetical protein Poli38472_014013 [Pythium oligandrum]|uniref:EF-hand domain-containing protein n=1 Tax=Pythium oligandrum TaxID=41045 RepID=A0A8K1CQ74_PYTOL|nr:hypothetical protein Poli38472_014013 [Pythium oligandrum]|eukprot:TMW66701.1 hypothetical protein Poli38472_014013 [Pythium oligandrum]
MSAALLQYQACLGILVRLQLEDLTSLKQDFDRVGRGLSLEEFVSVMLDRVSWEMENVISFIQDLVELFAQVDVNGDGTMEWEEFTSAIIEGGMGTTSDEMDWRDLQYEEHAAFSDVLNRPPKRVQYVGEVKRLLVHDNSRPVVEIIEPTTLYPIENDDASKAESTASTDAATFVPTLTIANKFHPLCYVAGYRRDQDDVRSERSPVQALKYLSQVDLIAVSGGDLKLTFWSSTILTAASTSALETPSPLVIVHTPRPQRVLEWNASTSHLYSISADLIISVWHVRREKQHDTKSKCEVSLVTTLKRHTDLLQDLLVLNDDVLLSCGMDSAIFLWDTQTLQVKATRQGHRRGVRLLAKLSDQLFLSTGFECEVLGWDINVLATAPVFKLWGHNAPVCCIQLIPCGLTEKRSTTDAATVGWVGDQAITVDDDGWFKWWNLANITSVENNDLEQNASRCLQTFRLGSDKYPWHAHSLAVLNNGQSILATGIHKLKLLHRTRLKPRVLPSSVVLYNSLFFTILTTTDREIRIWDAKSGTLLRTYRNISPSDITCVDLDARQRKIVVGTQRGELIVLNYLNGAVLKTWMPHQLTVSALIFCKEDACVLTASWDRSLRLYDDNASANTLLRCVTDAHDADIKALTYCYAMSLVATGSADGVIKIWDYIYFLLEVTCSTSTYLLPMSDVVALEFVDPYPLLVSGHENGTVCFWHVSPSQPSVLLGHYAPFLRDPTLVVTTKASQYEDETRGGIASLRVHYDESGGELLADGIRKGRFLVVLGSLDGQVYVDDMTQLIASAHLRAIREESMPSNHHGSYNPRRRFIRHGKNAKRLKNHVKHHEHMGIEASPDHPPAPTDAITTLFKWKAHQGSVRYLQVVDDPLTLLSCSHDRSVKVWRLDGGLQGYLVGTQSSGPGWNWEIDTQRVAELKREQAQEIWDKMRDAKLKLLTQRNTLAKLRLRQQRRTSLGMASTAALGVTAEQLAHLQGMNDEGEKKKTTITSSEAERLFQQLQGQVTWQQSDFQLARQEAWERERKKFHKRMKRIMKQKKATSAENQVDDEEHEEEDSVLRDLKPQEELLDPATTLLPSDLNSSVQPLPFDDKGNWAIGSLNRERQMYSHFHHENTRRGQKSVLLGSGKLRRSESTAAIDLTPSSFLLERLGESCVIQTNSTKAIRAIKTKPKKTKALRAVQSLPELPLPRGDDEEDENQDTVDDKQPRVLKRQLLVPQQSIRELFQQFDHVQKQHESEKATIHRASKLLTGKLGSRSERALSSLHEDDSKDETATSPTRAKPKPKSAQARTKKASLSDVVVTRRKALETKEKKQRLRSDAALMRLERFGPYPRDDVVNIYRTFLKIDKDGSGTITLRELVDGAGLFGSTHLRDNIISIFNSIDQDQSGHIDLRELSGAVFNEAPSDVLHDMERFYKLLESAERAKKTKKKQLTPEQVAEVTQLFHLYDADRNGDIDVDELLTALRYNEKFYDDDDAQGITKEDVERIIARFDVNTNATLDLHEFMELFREEL